MEEVVELRQVVSALIGGVVALASQWIWRKATKTRTARFLAIAFWEELSAAHFYGPEEIPNFTGFSSQTFDGLFREVEDSLPTSLSRDLMRYHWQMKYMESVKSVTMKVSGGVNPQLWSEANHLHACLLARLDRYRWRHWLSLFFRPSET